jgi:hypothetical protein
MSGTPYHYVLTIQAHTPAGLADATNAGTLVVPPGMTRTQVYEQVLRGALDRMPGGGERWVVLFWSLEPDVLS